MADLRGPEGLRPGADTLSRRAFTERAAGVAAGSLFAKLFSPEQARAAGLTIYEGGTPIETEYGSIQPDGWNLHINLDEVEQHSKTNGSHIEFELLGSYGPEHVGFSFTNGKQNYTPENVLPTIPTGGAKIGVLESLPNLHDDHIMLVIKESREGQMTKITPIFIKHETQTHVPEESRDKPRVFADGDVVSQEVLERVHKRGDRFKMAFPEADFPIFIYKNRYSDRSGVYIEKGNFLLVPGHYFTSEEAPEMGDVITDHERFHGVHASPSTKKLRARQADVQLEQSHLALWDAVAGIEPTPETMLLVPDKIRTHPAFAVFDESTYFPEFRKVEREDVGHPYGNYRELFASGMNVMTRFGNGVVEQIKNIEDPEAQAMAITFAQQILDLTDAMADDPKMVDRAFPKLVDVRNFLAETNSLST